jgi:hypothetical protein
MPFPLSSAHRFAYPLIWCEDQSETCRLPRPLPSVAPAAAIHRSGRAKGRGRVRLSGVAALKFPEAFRVALPREHTMVQATNTLW